MNKHNTNKPYKGIIDPYNIVTILFSDGYHDVVIGNLGERRIRTSPIVKRGEDYVETENSIYGLGELEWEELK